MDEKKLIYNIVLDLWQLFKDYALCDGCFTDNDWETFIKAAREQSKKYKQYGERYWNLYSNMYRSYEKYLIERRATE